MPTLDVFRGGKAFRKIEKARSECLGVMIFWFVKK